MSNREDIAHNIESVLQDMTPPRPVLVTREPFDVEKLAITQFPVLLITTGNETREDHVMGGGRRGVIEITIRGFVRADGRSAQIITVDQKRNELIERIEETLNSDRTRELAASQASTTRVRTVEIIDRTPPLGEFLITADAGWTTKKDTVKKPKSKKKLLPKVEIKAQAEVNHNTPEPIHSEEDMSDIEWDINNLKEETNDGNTNR